ncbi:MAG: response regulator [Prolixibacteraceae bacterium]|nr:response regulator [Prolixibacteraceae bacterium]
MKFLLLEDNASDAELTTRVLKKNWPRCKIEYASSVKEARKSLNQNPNFDIALLDMQLPDGNGMDILMEIRQNQLDIAVAMLTGSGDEEVAVAALKAGANDYTVKKPGYTDKIPQSVKLALENQRQFREHASGVIHVLYIEHNVTDVDFTRRHLTRYAPYIRITNVPNGEKALELLSVANIPPGKGNYQVVLMDYRLPGMNALELIKEIRQEQKLDIPILIVTGHGNEEVAVQALKVGASDYLVKRENYLTRLPSLITGAYQNCELKRKQKALAESEAKYRLLAENSGDVIFTLDFDLNYTYVSPAVYSLRGYTPEEVLNQKLSDVLTTSSFKVVKETLNKMFPKIKKGKYSFKPQVLELEMFKKDGSTIWAEIKITISTDSKLNPIGILGVSRNITKRRLAQEELRKLSRAVIQSPVSITITDVEGNIEFINPQFTKLTGYTFEEVIGRNPSILKSGKQPKIFYKDMWNTILSGNEWHGEFQNKKKNGELYWASTSISSLVNSEGEITHFVAVKEDVTEQKKLFEDLKTEKEKAQAADRLKTAFLNNISHEVRTPLNGILGFGEMLTEEEISQQQKKAYLEILKKSSNRLINTITSYMDISLIVSRNMAVNKKYVDINNLLDDLYQVYFSEAKEKGLDFVLTLDTTKKPQIDSDPGLLKKILSHLLDNAFKFTIVGTIKLGCEIVDRGIEFIVQDNGIGIDREKIDTIFEHFNQGEIGLTRGYEGSGLGLSIAKGLVELLGGELLLKSEKGMGTTISFILPCKAEEIRQLNRRSLEHTSVDAIVLIAEDDDVNRLYLETILKKEGFETLSACNGKEAVEKCRNQQKIGLVLMDIEMPVMDGLDATKLIKQFRPKLPIIATTAHALTGDEENVRDAGCDGYIAKPYNRKRLISLIKSYI